MILVWTGDFWFLVILTKNRFIILLDTKKGYRFERLVRDDAGSKSIALKSYAEVYSWGELKKNLEPEIFFLWR